MLKVSESKRGGERSRNRKSCSDADSERFTEQLVISPGWSHYTITASLSPKAYVSLTKCLRQLSERESSLSPFQSSALQLAMMDLGVLPVERESFLSRAMERALKTHASFKVQATRFRVSHAMNPHNEAIEGEPALLWLEFRDRLGVFGAIHQALCSHLSELAPDLCSPAPVSWRQHKKYLSEFSLVLCGVISAYKSDVYEQAFRCSAWVNELVLQKRPSLFYPNKGYESVWRKTLPLETPLLSEQEERELLPPTEMKTKSRLKYPLEGQNLKRLQALDELLEEQKSGRPNSHKETRQRRRRTSRRKSQARVSNRTTDSDSP